MGLYYDLVNAGAIAAIILERAPRTGPDLACFLIRIIYLERAAQPASLNLSQS